MTIKTEPGADARMCKHVHPRCVVCSPLNSKGLHLNFNVDSNGVINAVFACDETFEGYPGMLHGGVISTLLDGAMGHCMFAQGLAAVTVEMTTRFRHPVITGREALVWARIKRISHPLYLLEAGIEQNGELKANAKSKFYHKPEYDFACE